MLLLVIEADFEDAQHLAQHILGAACDQSTDRGVDMGAIGRDLRGARACNQATLGPLVARPRRDIVGIEQISETRVEGSVIACMRLQQELLEKPSRVRPVPFGGTGVRH